MNLPFRHSFSKIVGKLRPPKNIFILDLIFISNDHLFGMEDDRLASIYENNIMLRSLYYIKTLSFIRVGG